jgi:hypothetical protein
MPSCQHTCRTQTAREIPRPYPFTAQTPMYTRLKSRPTLNGAAAPPSLLPPTSSSDVDALGLLQRALREAARPHDHDLTCLWTHGTGVPGRRCNQHLNTIDVRHEHHDVPLIARTLPRISVESAPHLGRRGGELGQLLKRHVVQVRRLGSIGPARARARLRLALHLYLHLQMCI